MIHNRVKQYIVNGDAWVRQWEYAVGLQAEVPLPS